MPDSKPQDPFRDWIRRVGAREVGRRTGITYPNVYRWRRGGGVAPERMSLVKLEAAKDGVILSTDDLLPAPKGAA